MILPEVKDSAVIVPRSDLRVGTTTRRITSKKIIAKTTNIKDYRRLNNQLRRDTDRAKEVYMEEMCEEIMDL